MIQHTLFCTFIQYFIKRQEIINNNRMYYDKYINNYSYNYCFVLHYANDVAR